MAHPFKISRYATGAIAFKSKVSALISNQVTKRGSGEKNEVKILCRNWRSLRQSRNFTFCRSRESESNKKNNGVWVRVELKKYVRVRVVSILLRLANHPCLAVVKKCDPPTCNHSGTRVDIRPYFDEWLAQHPCRLKAESFWFGKWHEDRRL